MATSKKTSSTKKDKFYIDDYSSNAKKAVKENADKEKVRSALTKRINAAVAYAKKNKPEANMERLERIFSTNEAGKTIVTIRYGSIKFYQGIMNGVDVFKGNKENFDNKLGALKHLTEMVNADEWFDPQYKKYLKTKETADKRSAATKKTNKKLAATASAAGVEAPAKKATTKKKTTATKKPTAKKAAPKKATSSKAKTATKKTTAKKPAAKKTTAKKKTSAKKK